MDQKTAQNLGYTLKASNHSMKKRAPWHDYSKKGLYMLTLVICDRRPLFGDLRADPLPKVHLYPLGQMILDDEIGKIHQYYPMVYVWAVCIMPDHIHLILRVEQDLPEGKHLGHVVRGFKTGCNRAYWSLGAPEGTGLFERGYNDRLLFKSEQLQHWKNYLADNPRRLWLKRQNPDLFVAVTDLDVSGRRCQMIGNRFLLSIPDKMAVVVHRSDSEEQYRQKFQEWMACGERGGVLISAAVSPREKEVMHEAMERRYSVIWLRDNGFGPYYKPTGRSFDACASGQLLEISPFDYTPGSVKISRQTCLYLNRMAEEMAATPTLGSAEGDSDGLTLNTDPRPSRGGR